MIWFGPVVDGPEPLPPELLAFLHSCIESIEQIELLMMLRGSDRFRSAREVSADLRVAVGVARRDLETLAARGLLEVSVGSEITYRYRPKSDDLARRGDLLAQHYVTSRHSILTFVASHSRLAVKRFADAFKLREPE
jgi:predicted ArsR family transcriptional regulator